MNPTDPSTFLEHMRAEPLSKECRARLETEQQQLDDKAADLRRQLEALEARNSEIGNALGAWPYDGVTFIELQRDGLQVRATVSQTAQVLGVRLFYDASKLLGDRHVHSVPLALLQVNKSANLLYSPAIEYLSAGDQAIRDVSGLRKLLTANEGDTLQGLLRPPPSLFAERSIWPRVWAVVCLANAEDQKV